MSQSNGNNKTTKIKYLPLPLGIQQTKLYSTQLRTLYNRITSYKYIKHILLINCIVLIVIVCTSLSYHDFTATRQLHKDTAQPSSDSTIYDQSATQSVVNNADTAKLQHIRNSFLHAYNGYTTQCMGKDDLNPVSGTCNNGNGQLTALIDSLSTMQLMGLIDEFNAATVYINEHFEINDKSTSFFETTIRVLGGLLSAYSTSNNRIFIDKAVKLADGLKKAFKEHNLPFSEINMISGHTSLLSWARGNILLAEIGTFQMEFYYLSHITGDTQYSQYADNIYDYVIQQKNTTAYLDGLLPLYINPYTAEFEISRLDYSIGGRGDSYYEYLLKAWLLTGKSNDMLKQLYIDAMSGMMKYMYYNIGDSAWLAEITQRTSNQNTVKKYDFLPTQEPILTRHQMDHLACFMPGLMYLGVAHGVFSEQPQFEQQIKDAALKLTDTCYKFYTIADTGLPPEIAAFDSNTGDIYIHTSNYELRPEVLESITILYHLTGDHKYREMGWKIYQSIEQHTKVKYGYSSLHSCTNPQSYKDKMESFFLAETLKYLYLLFSDRSALPLTGEAGEYYVLNTEAHPLKSWKS